MLLLFRQIYHYFKLFFYLTQQKAEAIQMHFLVFYKINLTNRGIKEIPLVSDRVDKIL